MRRVRPGFHWECAAPPRNVVERMGEVLRAPHCPVSGLSCEGRIELHVHGEEQRLWSPQLIVDVYETQGGSELRGRFGPHPSVWTLYMAGYAACGFGALLFLSFGYAQWVMGASPWLFFGILLSAALGLALYFAAFLGQDAGSAQMQKLQGFLRDALADVVRPNRESSQ